MKKGKKFLVIALAATMVFSSVPVSAAPRNSNSYATKSYDVKNWFSDFWKNLFGLKEE